MLRSFWFLVGTLSLFLGLIGIVLPVLPTTPFVILAAFAFGKSSPRLQAWLERNHVFGPIIEDWREKGAIATRYKIMAISMMAAALLLSIVMDVGPVILVVQLACMIAAACFILTRPS
ncbi:MAG: YbaN family protein [Pseudomonadota bacterium]